MSLTKGDLHAIDTIVVKRVDEIVTARVKEGTEELAQIVSQGFENTATKADFESLHKDVTELKEDVSAITGHIEKIEDAFAMPKEERLRVRR